VGETGASARDSIAASNHRLPLGFTVVSGDHPVPGPASLYAADLIADAVADLQPGDIALVLLSGGTSSLAAAPVSGLALAVGDVERAQAHLANLADTLLESGLAIHEMNAIRRRLLRWGAGRLAIALHERGASRIPVFAISDVIGDDPAVIGSGPCSPDPLDEPSFLALLDAHDVRNALERDTALFLGLAGAGRPPIVAPAAHPAFGLVDYEIVARNRDAVHALSNAARLAGVDHVFVDPTPLEGDAAPLGDRIARYAIAQARTLPPNESATFVFGGEPVVNLRATYERAWADGDDEQMDAPGAVSALLGDDSRRAIDDLRAAFGDGAMDLLRSTPRAQIDEPMRGGRMQVLALSAAFALEEAAAAGEGAAWRITLLAAGTDGRDGPTDAAGAIVDAATAALARRGGRRPEQDLATGRSWFPLDAADALLRSGATGTNVMDVVAVYVSRLGR
jgi:hydroxypyruvate reductase